MRNVEMSQSHNAESDAYYIADLEDKILDTVQSYVENVPRPFGLLLSGGFDSGLLAALTKPDYVFRVRFPYGVKYDESRYANAIIKHLGLGDKVVTLTPTEETFKKDAEDAVKTMGEETTHFSLVPFYSLMKLVSEQMADKGVDPHVLSGEGPDEYLGGYSRQIIFDEFKKLYRIPELRAYHGMIEKLVGSEDEGLIRKYAELVGYPKSDVESFISDNEGLYSFQGMIGKMDMEIGVIETMEQKVAGRFKVNLHYPFINDEFAEYCYKLPDDFKIRNGVTKWGYRQVCMKYLPEIMRDRAKMGGPVAPVNKWMGWDDEGEFNKRKWIDHQKTILGK